MGCATAWRPEESRFGVGQSALAKFISTLIRPKRAKTSGSRERPTGSQVYGQV